ncbi:hypothetical protein QJQ45_008203 [Haematococcus lacustris]|nr:hypothetical protein QJQ45_008203 [Haematococcus lacustris]
MSLHPSNLAGSPSGWKAGAVREDFRKVVEQPSRPNTDDTPDRLVIMDEFRTSRVSSSVHARQPCELHLPNGRPRLSDRVPPALVPPPQAPPWGRWLDRDTNGCLNFQGIGESMQRPLELCSWKDREALPPVGDEYQQRCKWVNDRLPKGDGSRWRPLELCYWPAKGALPAKGKEYPGLGYKRLRDEPPKSQEQQPVVAQ